MEPVQGVKGLSLNVTQRSLVDLGNDWFVDNTSRLADQFDRVKCF